MAGKLNTHEIVGPRSLSSSSSCFKKEARKCYAWADWRSTSLPPPLTQPNMTIEGPISVPAAIVIGLISSFIQSLGLTIQRKSHIQNAQVPALKQRSEWKRPLWVVGFVIFIVANIAGTVFQIGALPIVMLAPLGAVSLLYNALLARFILDDLFSRFMIVGTLFIAAGAFLIGFFGVVQEPAHSLDDLLALFGRPTFIVFASLFALTFVAILTIAHLTEWQLHTRLFRPPESKSKRRDGKSKKKKKPLPRRWSAPSLAPVAEVSESSSGIATPVLAVADEAARKGIPIDRVLIARASSQSKINVQAQTKPASQSHIVKPKNYGSIPAQLSPSSRGVDAQSELVKDLQAQSTSAAAIAAAQNDPAIRRTCIGLAIVYGGASGTLSGACLLLAKSGVELLIYTFEGHNQFTRWQSWLIVLSLVVAALLQLWYLNKGLRFASPPLVCPLAFCFYNTSSIALGLVYFDQLGALSATSIVLVIVGTMVLLAGVWIVSLHGPEISPEEMQESVADIENRQPLMSDIDETVSSPTSLLPRSPLSNVVTSSPTETSSLLANAAGVAGPHLPPQSAAGTVTSVKMSPEMSRASAQSSSSTDSSGGSPRHRRSRSGSGSGRGSMGGLGMHMPGLPQHPAEEETRPDVPQVPDSSGVADEQGAGQKARISRLKGTFAALSMWPPSKRKGLYDVVMERGLSIGISPSSPGFHVASSFELESGLSTVAVAAEDLESVDRLRRKVNRRTFSENDTSVAAIGRQRQQEARANGWSDGLAAVPDEAVSQNSSFVEDAEGGEDEAADQRSVQSTSTSTWARVMPSLDVQYLNDRLRRYKTETGRFLDQLRNRDGGSGGGSRE